MKLKKDTTSSFRHVVKHIFNALEFLQVLLVILPVSVLLVYLCFNVLMYNNLYLMRAARSCRDCKKLNTIFKRQTMKNRLEMSVSYRIALLFSIVVRV